LIGNAPPPNGSARRSRVEPRLRCATRVLVLVSFRRQALLAIRIAGVPEYNVEIHWAKGQG
jgi:hypothetical protein